MVVTLGYWKLRGLAQPIRFLLEYTETPYTEKLYTIGPAPEYNRDDWLNDKFNLGLDFPNLPYLLDGDVKLSQTNAILRHIARKTKMDGNSDNEKQRIDILEFQIIDIRTQWFKVHYFNDNFERDKKEYIDTKIPLYFQLLSDFLATRKYFAGENVSYIDFVIYELLDIHRLLVNDCLDKYQNLKEFQTRIESLDAISKYMKSDRFIKWPLHGPMANFGG